MTIISDMNDMEKWFIKCMKSEGFVMDGTIKSIKQCDQFMEKYVKDGEPIKGTPIEENFGPICLAMAAYIGNVMIRYKPGKWVPNPKDPDDEIGISLVFDDTTICWPTQRVWKRVQNGSEDGLFGYAYLTVGEDAIASFKPIKAPPKRSQRIVENKPWWKIW